MRLWIVLAALQGGLLPSSARADRELGLQDALNLAREKNRDLKAAKTKIEQAYAQVEQARAALIPTVAANGKYTHNYKEVTLDLTGANQLSALNGQLQQDIATDVYGKLAGLGAGAPSQKVIDESTQLMNLAANQPSTLNNIVIQRAEQLDFSLSATVPLIVPWAYSSFSSSKKGFDAAKANYQATEASLLVQTAQAFFAAAGTDELTSARRNAIGVAKQTLSNAKARLDAGVVNRVEVTRAELALLRADQALRETLDSQASAYRALRTIIQLDEPFHVVTRAVDPLPGEATDELAKNALHLRPEFLALEKNRDAADSQLSSSRWRWAPTLTGFGNLRAFNYAGFAGDNYAWALGLSLDWLIYDGGIRDAQARLARSQRDELGFRLDQLKDTVNDDIRNARSAVTTKGFALETAQRSVSLSKETLELVRVQHDAGTATQLDLLTAQDALVSAEVAVAQARFDLSLSDLLLRRAAGLFPGPQ